MSRQASLALPKKEEMKGISLVHFTGKTNDTKDITTFTSQG